MGDTFFQVGDRVFPVDGDDEIHNDRNITGDETTITALIESDEPEQLYQVNGYGGAYTENKLEHVDAGIAAERFLQRLHQGAKHCFLWTSDGLRSAWYTEGDPLPKIGGQNLYFGVHPCTQIPPESNRGNTDPRYIRSQLAYIGAINGLFSEFDAKDHGNSKHKVLEFIKAGVKSGKFPRPSVIIDSGGGYHCYWLFPEPFLLSTDAKRQRAARLQRAWVQLTGGDQGAQDLARILRLPGSKNHKYKPPRPVRFIRCAPSVTYSLGDLEALAASAMTEIATSTPTPPRALDEHTRARYDAYVRQALDDILAEIETAQPGTRDNTLYKLACRIGDLVGAWWANLDRQEAINAAFQAASRNSLFAEIGARNIADKIERGIDHGAQTPAPEPQDNPLPTSTPTLAPDDLAEAQELAEKGAENSQKANTSAAGEIAQQGFFKTTDMGNGQRLATWYGNAIRYCDDWGGWLVWDGKRWAIDKTCRIEWLAKQAVRGIYAEAARCEDDAIRKGLGAWARKSESGVRRREMVKAARSEPGIAIMPEALDADPWVLNVNNGLIDLRTGELQPHKRETLVTKLAPVDYDSAAECPRWTEFLDKIMASDTDMIEFLQRAIGYTLTGDVSERALFILHGTGDNGKSTMLETIRAMLGDYAMSAEAKTFTTGNKRAASSDIARLKGARLVTASESERGDKLAEALVKQLTGGDRRTARFNRQDEIEYTPTDKPWIATNHKPEVKGTDPAIWNRIKLIPFAVTIPKDKQDKKLRAKLETELPGILAWAVRGCLDWQKRGLAIPEPVTEATQGYRLESDTLGRFIADRCVVHENAKSTLKDLYSDYMAWCIDTGEANMTKREFSAALSERGFEKYIGTARATMFRGVGQQAQGNLPDPDPLNF